MESIAGHRAGRGGPPCWVLRARFVEPPARSCDHLTLIILGVSRTRIVLVGDTHAFGWNELHPRVRSAVAEADIAVHAGDIVRMAVVRGMRAAAKRLFVVHGNSDPPELRAKFPDRVKFEVDGVRVGVTHPAWGGPEFPPEVLLADFPEGVDVIMYGHLHTPVNESQGDVLFLNGGQPYSQFLVPVTIAWLTIENGQASGEIELIEPART